MKLKNIAEHIGHGTHLYHVSVCCYDADGDVLMMVAANDEQHALAQAITNVLGLGDTDELPVDTLEDSRVYEIGEIEHDTP